MAKKFGFMKKKVFADFKKPAPVEKEGKKEDKKEKGKEEICSKCKSKSK